MEKYVLEQEKKIKNNEEELIIIKNQFNQVEKVQQCFT